MSDSRTFYCYQLIINENNISAKGVDEIVEKSHKESIDHEEKIISFSKENDGFIDVLFEHGKTMPRPSKLNIIGEDRKEKNKRKRSQYEPKVHHGLIDINRSVVWIEYSANTFFKSAMENWFESTYLKPIHDEEEFLNAINQVTELKLGVQPDVFNIQNELSHALENDIFAYDAEYAELIIKFKDISLRSKLRNKLKKLKGDKYKFKKFVVCGKDEKGLEWVFNKDVVNTKITIEDIQDENGVSVSNNIFEELKRKINEIDI